MHAST
jgi:glycerol uptake facilitator-like aquaporin